VGATATAASIAGAVAIGSFVGDDLTLEPHAISASTHRVFMGWLLHGALWVSMNALTVRCWSR
jgi:hypothetical protein